MTASRQRTGSTHGPVRLTSPLTAPPFIASAELAEEFGARAVTAAVRAVFVVEPEQTVRVVLYDRYLAAKPGTGQ
ncbi:hypothetical protein [Streptomyces sp. NBC_01262]|uniref:hypothetical protein n=1 Tax=Streptomyces sp. NBC_01262 TaxID=2903803 RepID=UPI002E3570B2|nr:hypothetical protein [Streptomyces sp. NBC_01262]